MMQNKAYTTISAGNKPFEMMQNKAYATISGQDESFETEKKEVATYETVDLTSPP